MLKWNYKDVKSWYCFLITLNYDKKEKKSRNLKKSHMIQACFSSLHCINLQHADVLDCLMASSFLKLLQFTCTKDKKRYMILDYFCRTGKTRRQAINQLQRQNYSIPVLKWQEKVTERNHLYWNNKPFWKKKKKKKKIIVTFNIFKLRFPKKKLCSNNL